MGNMPSLVSAPGTTPIWCGRPSFSSDRHGLTVPMPIPTTDGRLFVNGLMVMTYVEGGPPGTESDWQRVAETLRQLHRLTQGWPQRPGWRSSTDLLDTETATRINLSAVRSCSPPSANA